MIKRLRAGLCAVLLGGSLAAVPTVTGHAQLPPLCQSSVPPGFSGTVAVEAQSGQTAQRSCLVTLVGTAATLTVSVAGSGTAAGSLSPSTCQRATSSVDFTTCAITPNEYILTITVTSFTGIAEGVAQVVTD